MSIKSKQANFLLQLCSLLLILLWSYTSMSKLVDVEKFHQVLKRQSMLSGYAGALKYVIPLAELMTAILLAIPRRRAAGLLISLIWMCFFTLYVGLAVFNVFEMRPCACGGVLSSLSWTAHLYFNVSFLLISLTAVILEKRRFKRPFPN